MDEQKQPPKKRVNLPALADVYSGDLAKVRKGNDLNILLNQDVKPDWVEKHPIAKQKVNGVVKPVEFISIARVEYLLTAIFIHWHVEIRETALIANSVVVTIRLHFHDPVTNNWRWQDGIGAAPIQTDKDAAATDFSRVKSDAVMKAAPAAKSFAIKDAAHHLGKLFGKDLNRRDHIDYDVLTKKFDPVTKLRKTLSKLIGQCQDPETTAAIMDAVLDAEENGTDTEEFYTELIKTHFNHENTD